MFDSDSKKHVQQAEEYFSNACIELFKPYEDVVNYVVCKNSYRTVFHYLKAHLLDNQIEIPVDESVENLLRLCRKVDGRFEGLNLNPLFNPLEKEDVWMDYSTAHQFIELAKKTKNLYESRVIIS